MRTLRRNLFILIIVLLVFILSNCDLFLPVSIEKRIDMFEKDISLPLGDRGDTYLNFHPDIRATLAGDDPGGVWETNFSELDGPFVITITLKTDNGDGTYTVDCIYTENGAPAAVALRFIMKKSDKDWYIYSLIINPGGAETIIPN